MRKYNILQLCKMRNAKGGHFDSLNLHGGQIIIHEKGGNFLQKEDVW